MDSYSEDFKKWMDERNLTSKNLAPMIKKGEQTLNNWRSQGVPTRESVRSHIDSFMEDYDSKKVAELEMMDVINLEISSEKFDNWNRAALQKKLIIRDWAIQELDKLAKKEFANVTDFPEKKTFRFPGQIAAGAVCDMWNDDQTIDLDSDLSPENHILVEICGQSGEPDFADGDRWLVCTDRQGMTAADKKPAIFQDPNGQYLKRFNRKRKALESINPDHEDLAPLEGMKLIGYPVEKLS